MPKYSIVLPVRNGGEYIKECVESILDQTVTDFNLIVLDNCSTDGTLEWITLIKDSRIQIYPSAKPLSIEENWGRIPDVAKNKFMTFIGHDDLLDHNFLEVMDRLINEHPEAGFYQVHSRYIDEKGNKTGSCKPMDEIQNSYQFLAFFLSGMSELTIGQVMLSDRFDKMNGLPKYPHLLFADLELWINLINKRYRAVAMEECCSKRIHNSSTTNSSSSLIYYYSFIKLLEYFIKLKQSDVKFAEVFERYGLQFLASFSKTISHHLLRIPLEKRNGINVKGFLNQFKSMLEILIPNNDFNPDHNFSTRLASDIDSNIFSRKAFLLFKKIYSRPLLHT